MASFKPYEIFDIHTHTYPAAIAEKACVNLGHFYDFVTEGSGTYDDLAAQSRETGTVGFLLFSVATNPKQVTKVNDSIAALTVRARSEGFLAAGFAGLHQDTPDMEAELDRCMGLGLCGVKMHPDIQQVAIDDPRMMWLYGACQERGLPVLLHMGDSRYPYSRPELLAKVMKRFPRLTMIGAHFGGYSVWEDAEKYLWGRFENLWYDCSSALWAMDALFAEKCVRGCGVDRVCYGTDYPVMNLAHYLDLFLKIPLTEEERRAVLCGNARRLLDL